MEEKLIHPGILSKEDGAWRLIGGRCKCCGKTVFPKGELCYGCLSEEVEEVPVSSHGKLYSYTVSYMPSGKLRAPYAVGYVRLDDGVRIFTPLDIDRKNPPKIGAAMELEVTELWKEEDVPCIGFRFKCKEDEV